MAALYIALEFCLRATLEKSRGMVVKLLRRGQFLPPAQGLLTVFQTITILSPYPISSADHTLSIWLVMDITSDIFLKKQFALIIQNLL